MLEELRRLIREALTTRAAEQERIDGVLAAAEAESRSELTEGETATFTEARTRLTEIDTELEGLRSREAELVDISERRTAAAAITVPDVPEARREVRVGSEPLTYRRGGQHSYFRDLAKANAPGVSPDPASVQRLQRHSQEMEVELRADMDRGAGTGGEFVPPLWLTNEYVSIARAGRVTAELCRNLPLPTGTDSVNIATVDSPTATAEQSDGNVVQKTDMETESVSAAVTTIAGQQVFAMQLLDQSPMNVDEIVFADLLGDLATKVDQYVISKASIGILNVTDVNAVTFTSGSPTVALLYPKLADAIQRIATLRFMGAQAIVMHPRRWGWILSSLDDSNRPLVVPSPQGPQNAFAGMDNVRAEGQVGSILGLPVYTDANVPANLGAGTDEDRIIAARFDDLYLFEGSIRARTLFETDADRLKVRLQVWEYLAFLGSRYPKSVSVVAGTGLVTPTF